MPESLGETPTANPAAGGVLLTASQNDEDREEAIASASLRVFSDFFTRSVPQRIWEPLSDLPVEEMHAHGHKLSPDTVHLIEGFMGIEEYVGDYVQEGLEAYRAIPTRRRLMLQWGAEEARHGAALHEVLLHSEARTPAQLDDYETRLADRRWASTQHKGVVDPLTAFVYAAFQERATYINYVELRRRVRSEYGLPDHITPEEMERGHELGVSEALRRIALDEVAHHAVFLNVLRANLRYFRERTVQRIEEILDGFTMPALKLIPNRRHFVSAMLRTQLYGEARHEEQAVRPTLKMLGLAGALASH